MTTALITHPDCLNHVTPEGHPERVARLQAILAALKGEQFDALKRVEAPLADKAQITRAHPSDYFERVKASEPASGWAALDGDTHMSNGSFQAALRAAGANVKAVDMVMSGDADNAFCAVRPPGHHAETATSMGFCLFGSVVIGAKHALEHHGLSRVAIIDFDVHHGNGTQDLVWNDDRIFFGSTHQMPLYPGSGAAHETGGSGNVMNIPLAPNADGQALKDAFEKSILPALYHHKPQMIFISAGFDAHHADPLANLNFNEDDFAWATRQLKTAAKKLCQGRLVSTLEGGYDLDALAASTAAHVKVLMEH
ncbi:MAG: histone deacetylase family protein [Proteobacteria bacterium]|nr:histone deacetylase family protein [Pseudomonadota bacterium]